VILNPNSHYRSPEGYQSVQTHYAEQLSRWPVPYTTRWIETRHGGTHVLCAGRVDDAAPALFLFHGWGGNQSGAYQEYDLALLGQHFRLILPDTIGQSGRSVAHRLPTSGPDYGEWVLDLFDALGIDRTYVAGISGGGYLSLKIAAYAPDRVIKALVISSAGLASLTPSPRFLLGALPVRIYPSKATARRFVYAASGPAALKTWRHDRMVEDMLMVFKHYQFDSGPRPLADSELRRISAPVYLLMGAQDRAVKVAHSISRARALLASVAVETVTEAGHLLTLDCPGLAEQRMLAFFQ
jgi:pimeloyl-ACP methyl ester carboxylesterase